MWAITKYYIIHNIIKIHNVINNIETIDCIKFIVTFLSNLLHIYAHKNADNVVKNIIKIFSFSNNLKLQKYIEILVKSTIQAITTPVAIKTFFSKLSLVNTAVLKAHWCQDNHQNNQLKNQIKYIAIFEKLKFLNLGYISNTLNIIKSNHIIIFNIVVLNSNWKIEKNTFKSKLDNLISK